MIRNDGSQITRCIMSGSITFENILPIRVLKWLVILVGCKMKGINEQKNLKIHFSGYAHYNSINIKISN